MYRPQVIARTLQRQPFANEGVQAVFRSFISTASFYLHVLENQERDFLTCENLNVPNQWSLISGFSLINIFVSIFLFFSRMWYCGLNLSQLTPRYSGWLVSHVHWESSVPNRLTESFLFRTTPKFM